MMSGFEGSPFRVLGHTTPEIWNCMVERPARAKEMSLNCEKFWSRSHRLEELVEEN